MASVLSCRAPRVFESDVKILANKLLSAIPEIRDLLIPVSQQGRNRRAVTAALEHLSRGGVLIVFPAGEVSQFQWCKRAIADPRWAPGAARIAMLAGDVTLVPIHIAGGNSIALPCGRPDSSAGTNRAARPRAFEQAQSHYRSPNWRAQSAARNFSNSQPIESGSITCSGELRSSVLASSSERTRDGPFTIRPQTATSEIAPAVDRATMAGEIDLLPADSVASRLR